MSAKELFVKRYSLLGWKFKCIKPRQAIRTNPINADEKNVISRLESKGVELEKIPFLENGYWIRRSSFSVGATPEYLLGLYSIQEAAAQIPATLFTDLNEKVILDTCAAPGGKTVQLASLMRNEGVIVALDVDRRRMVALSNQLERCRVRNTVACLIDSRKASKLEFKFDRVLVDVPCSGNFATDKLWFNNRTLKDVKRNALLQRQILSEAVRVLADEGEIVYSTCSLEPEEDELNVNWAIKTLNLRLESVDCLGEKGLTEVFGKQLDASLENCRRIWPGQTQGFFVCKLKKADA